jgi:hypothetical protein
MAADAVITEDEYSRYHPSTTRFRFVRQTRQSLVKTMALDFRFRGRHRRFLADMWRWPEIWYVSAMA